MENKNEPKVEVSKIFEGQPNARLDDFEEDILNNEFAGEAEGKAPEGAVVIGATAPALSTEDKFMLLMEQMSRIAAGTEARELRAESIRQKGYSEINPDSPWNPEGRRDRAKLSRPTHLHGIQLNPMQLFEEEILLFNQLKPGRYLDRKIEVRVTQDGSVDLSWPGAKNDARIEMYSTYPTLTSMLKAVVAERKAKEEKRRKGVFDDTDSLND